MIIKRIHTMVAITALDHKFSFDSNKHKLDYHPLVNMFKVDNVLIPVSNIREVLVEDEEVQVIRPSKLTKEEIATAKALPDDGVMMTHSDQDGGRVQVLTTDTASLNAPEVARPIETVTKSKTKVKK